MPMMPGPLAAATYLAIKVAGYAGFASRLNRMTGADTKVWRFGAAKTGIGLVGGLAYMFAILPALDNEAISDLAAYLGVFPIRLLAWTVALSLFYGLHRNPRLLLAAAAAGTVWSYVLDGAMAVLLPLPGMQMGFC